MTVCLVNMPYAGIERPSIPLGQLKALLEAADISTEVVYANLWFAEDIGIERYQFFEITRSEDLLGEWTFAGAAFPDFQPDHDSYLDQLIDRLLLGGTQRQRLQPARLKQVFWEMRHAATQFIERVAHAVLEKAPKLVGCTSTFQQHVPSLALLRRIRELAPEITTMLGGANCETVMGRTTHREFNWVDYVVSGEAETIIIDLVRAVLARGKKAQITGLGIYAPQHRKLGYPTSSGRGDGSPRATTESLAGLPPPHYEEYFQTLQRSSLATHIRPGLLLETSRGCWWGAIKHCTFCGLNGGAMDFRSKPADEIIHNFDALATQHDIHDFEIVDNILDMDHFETVLPQLAQSTRHYRVFYETKSNLKRRHVERLARAGVHWIQPGIESLHTEVLALIGKGAKGFQHVQLLKWCREFGVRVSWNFLFAFPGEQDAWYAEMAAWPSRLSHLQPPGGLTQIRFDRYSPYHTSSEKYGLKLKPGRMYKYVYPMSPEALADQCYFFEHDAEIDYGRNAFIGKPLMRAGLEALRIALTEWSRDFWSKLPPMLCVEPHGEDLKVLDTRSCAAETWTTLTGLARDIYRACDDAPGRKNLVDLLRSSYGFGGDEADVWAAVDWLDARKLVMLIDDRVLSLAVSGLVPKLPERSEFPGGFISIAPATERGGGFAEAFSMTCSDG